MRATLTAEEYVLLEPGYRSVFHPVTGETIPVVEKKDSRLSGLRRGQRVRPRRVLVQQHEPPKGLSEAALIRLLRQRMIGRPSTYASITATLLRREYVCHDAGLLFPTGRGRAACDFLLQQYPLLFDPGFSARLEEQLDAIAAGKARYRDVVQTVWDEIQTKGDRHAANDRTS